MFLDMSRPLRLGVSRCLLGEAVRYDGAARESIRAWWPREARIAWIGVCPEVEVGMGVPREAVQLEDAEIAPRMRGVESRIDHTCDLHRWAGHRLTELGVDDLDGFVLKSRSPSCGLLDAELLQNGEVRALVDGLFTAALRNAFPFLPLTTEARVENVKAREHFLRRAQLYRAYKDLIASGAPPEELRAHHAETLRALRAMELTVSPAERITEACESACVLEGAEKAQELTIYGQLLHDLLDPKER